MSIIKKLAAYFSPSVIPTATHVDGDANADVQPVSTDWENTIPPAKAETVAGFSHVLALEKTQTMHMQSLLPGFHSSASGRIDPTQNADMVRRRTALRDALVPSQPVTTATYFVGRSQQLERLILAVEEERSHVVLYGKRGLGKTSLINIFAQIARQSGYIVLLDAPGAHASFANLFRSFLAQIPLRYSRATTISSTASDADKYFDSLLPAGDYGPRELSDVLSLITKTRIILFIDEYDRVVDTVFRSQLAELIKNLSDRAARVSLVILGVAANLDQLLGHHPSIRRNIVGIPIVRMSAAEVTEILTLGAAQAGITYAPDAQQAIVEASGGSPYYTRLMALNCCRLAIESSSAVVEMGHLKQAARQVSTEFSIEFDSVYKGLLAHKSQPLAATVIRKAARWVATEDDAFTSDQLQAFPLPKQDKAIKINDFTSCLEWLSDSESTILQCATEANASCYRFINPDFAFYVMLCGLL